jgi:GDPmannose 4,6-dehydratase
MYAHGVAEHYRTAYGLFIAAGILFNHESERRGETFVTRKITRGLARIKYGLEKKLVLGNITAWRDWGFSPEYVRGMHLMLQHPTPKTLVLGTGETHTVAEFLALVKQLVGGIPDDAVITNQDRYLRPEEVDHLQADPSRAKMEIGWTATTKFPRLVEIMVEHDLNLARRESR